ncbi:hypothetical protein ND436_002795 [Neisseria gonorrhoeae]|nr:hypothetical protein [Neisseria gonorrhoeae]UYP52469.1 hypothetical protein ND436_002795 [Neisseria gonorrhoeae]
MNTLAKPAVVHPPHPNLVQLSNARISRYFIDAALLAKSIMLLIMPTALFIIRSIAEINTLPILAEIAKNCAYRLRLL